MDFSIDLATERIYDAKTREIFEEVRQAFAVGNYRSATVMLWTVVICDLLYKLQELRDLYSDGTAGKILQEISLKQKARPKSPEWEVDLVKMVAERTQLLDGAEHQEIVNLQNYRNLCAHPVLGMAELLYRPNKETVRACIRSMLESVLLKPPILSKRVIDNVVEDLAAKKDLLLEDSALRSYLEAKYLKNLKPEIENSLFRALWKFVFNLTNADTDANRLINSRALSVLYSRRPREIESYIEANQAYFSELSEGQPLSYLIRFLRSHPRIFNLLTDAAKVPIRAFAEQNIAAYADAWFLSPSLSEHLANLKTRAKNTLEEIPPKPWLRLRSLAEVESCLSGLIDLGVVLYANSTSFDNANSLFDMCIQPFLGSLTSAQALELLDATERNSQINSSIRSRSHRDMTLIRAACIPVLGEDFDFAKYPHFDARSREDK